MSGGICSIISAALVAMGITFGIMPFLLDFCRKRGYYDLPGGRTKTGKLVGVRIATDDEDVMLITDKGTIIRLKVKDISVLGRSTQGVTLMRTTDGGKVVSIETLTPDMEDIEE